jgi:hypothetical protein
VLVARVDHIGHPAGVCGRLWKLLSWVGLDIGPTIVTEITKHEVQVLIGRGRKRYGAHRRGLTGKTPTISSRVPGAVNAASVCGSFHRAIFVREYVRWSGAARCNLIGIGDDLLTLACENSIVML